MKWPIFILLVLTPIPFGSARPVWQWFWISYLSIFTLYFCLNAYRSRIVLAVGGIESKLYLLFVMIGFVGLLRGALSPIEAEVVAPQARAYFTDEGMLLLCHFLSLYFLLKVTRLSAGIRKNHDFFVRTIFFCVAILSIYGILAYYSGTDTVLWYRKWASISGVSSTFVNKNTFAYLVNLGLLTAVYHYFQRYFQMGGRQGRADPKVLLHKISLAIPALTLGIIFLSTLFLTSSRSGVLSGIFALTIFLAFVGWRVSALGFVFPRKLVFFAVVMLIGIFLVSGKNIYTRVLQEELLGDRLQIYGVAVEIFLDNWLLGYGFGSFPQLFMQYRPLTLETTILKAHSDFLEILVATGLVGGLVFVAFCVTAIRRLLIISHDINEIVAKGFALSLVFLSLSHSLVDFPLQIPANSFFLTILLAVCYSQMDLKRCKGSVIEKSGMPQSNGGPKQ